MSQHALNIINGYIQDNHLDDDPQAAYYAEVITIAEAEMESDPIQHGKEADDEADLDSANDEAHSLPLNQSADFDSTDDEHKLPPSSQPTSVE